MKHGKRPTVEQRKLMEHLHMNPKDWLVVKDTPTEIVFQHRLFDRMTKTFEKGGSQGA